MGFDPSPEISLGPITEKEPAWRRVFSTRFWLATVILFGHWVILSGRFDAFHLALGVFSCLLVAYISVDLLFPNVNLGVHFRLWGAFSQYIPWLIWEIVKANWHVLKLCFRPDAEAALEPQMVSFKSYLRSDLALVTLANSITLTPGTITVRVDADGNFLVHAIDPVTADLEALRAMEARVARTFGEKIRGA